MHIDFVDEAFIARDNPELVLPGVPFEGAEILPAPNLVGVGADVLGPGRVFDGIGDLGGAASTIMGRIVFSLVLMRLKAMSLSLGEKRGSISMQSGVGEPISWPGPAICGEMPVLTNCQAGG